MEERMVRSAPDALRYEPGVSVQQTAHAQASPYVRGLTGQQVVHVFDGVRLNNGIYRQGPNQYFFTVDAGSLEELRVVRGSASTVHGSDALGGAIIAIPRLPRLHSPDGEWRLGSRLAGSARSADREIGGRGEVELTVPGVGAGLIGVGYRSVSRLRAGGVVYNPVDGEPALVPRFEESVDYPNDPERWRTQLGTGFEEVTFDGRWVSPLQGDLRVELGVYGYRQYDAPRTDQCPAPEAPRSECLVIDEQFRTLAVAAIRGDAGPFRDLDLNLSVQRHHERRRRDRPRSFVRFDWLDGVDTYGVGLQAASRSLGIGEEANLRFRYGLDAYQDRVQSEASQTLTDLGLSFPLSRGQYLSGSRYVSLGAFSEARLQWGRLGIRGGGRFSLIGIDAPPDDESGTLAVRQRHPALVGQAGASFQIAPYARILLGYDQGFRAPNLDDLTSRQQTGPGFQFENPALQPERSQTWELGVDLRRPGWRADVWLSHTVIDDAIVRAVREESDCPAATPQCPASRTQYQLVNAPGRSRILGAETSLWRAFDFGLTLRGSMSWAWGDGQDVGGEPGGPRVPLSRIPPLTGTLEASYHHLETGLRGGVALRLAASQDRLAPSDANDARIPVGGTPGYAVLDVRIAWRYGSTTRIALVWENVFDQAYRVHGSSINGPGMGLNLALEWGI
jgi:iron complex outermembrane receptor protein/hemoglobin/transferrin/lactoferrin receptor protein